MWNMSSMLGYEQGSSIGTANIGVTVARIKDIKKEIIESNILISARFLGIFEAGKVSVRETYETYCLSSYDFFMNSATLAELSMYLLPLTH